MEILHSTSQNTLSALTLSEYERCFSLRTAIFFFLLLQPLAFYTTLSWPNCYIFYRPKLQFPALHSTDSTFSYNYLRATLRCGSLRHHARSRNVQGSIPSGVIKMVHWLNPSARRMALGSTQSLTEMSTIDLRWKVEAAGAYVWQTCHLQLPIV